MKAYKIEGCFYCPVYRELHFERYCYKKQKPKLIDETKFSINYIPDWCPLPDYKYEKHKKQ